MEVKTNNLPDNIEVLKQMIVELIGENALLKNRLNTLLRNSYGTKSEKFDSGQLALFAELLEDAKEAQPQEPCEPKEKVKGHGRQKLPRNLPRKQVIHDLPEEEKSSSAAGN